MRTFFILLAVLTSTALAGTPNAAARYARAYEQAMKTWIGQVQAAPNNDAQVALWAKRPNPVRYGEKIWVEIRNNLDGGWTLDHAAWVLENAPSVLAPKPNSRRESGAIRIRKAVERFHIKSARVGYYCIALTKLGDPSAMAILGKIEKQNPDKRIQGAAALGQAILLRKLDQGGSAKIVQQRRVKLRKAIIDGHDLTIGKRKLTSVAQAEVDRLVKLSVGAIAPELKGVDIALKAFSLQDYRQKVVVLFFWHSWMEDVGRSLDIMRKFNDSLAGKQAVLIGVNADHAKTLRRMTAEGITTWRNFFDNKRTLSSKYHVDTWPQVYVLDQEGKIKYKGTPGSFVELAVADLLKKK